jgi:hypothetical protein
MTLDASAPRAFAPCSPRTPSLSMVPCGIADRARSSTGACATLMLRCWRARTTDRRVRQHAQTGRTTTTYTCARPTQVHIRTQRQHHLCTFSSRACARARACACKSSTHVRVRALSTRNKCPPALQTTALCLKHIRASQTTPDWRRHLGVAAAFSALLVILPRSTAAAGPATQMRREAPARRCRCPAAQSAALLAAQSAALLFASSASPGHPGPLLQGGGRQAF